MSDTMLPNLQGEITNFENSLELLRQLSLLNESSLITFARDRGLPVGGIISGDPGDLHGRGWLIHDGLTGTSEPLFHPFRLYVLWKVYQSCKVRMAPLSGLLPRERIHKLLDKALEYTIDLENTARCAYESNQIVSLATLLEPLYWPDITLGQVTGRGGYDWQELSSTRQPYREDMLAIVRALDQEQWRGIHERLRFDAYSLDSNDKLYALLRLSRWEERAALKGAVSCALWIRHIAEVIRRGFEEAFELKWLEEDDAHGTWYPGARRLLYGAERVFDEPGLNTPYLASEFGVFTGSQVRWYVEGQTEYYAAKEILGEPSWAGVELVNLRGEFVNGKNNPFRLEEALKQDIELRRFSMITFDSDVKQNVKTIQNLVNRDLVVGHVSANTPDFEFQNFTVQELVEIAASVNRENGLPDTPVLEGDWTHVGSASAFEAKYKSFSGPGVSLKNEQGGIALAQHALSHPQFPNSNEERAFIRDIRAALRARSANYDLQKERMRIDVVTFELVERDPQEPEAMA